MRSEENSLGWYVKNSLEVLLQGVRATSVIRSEETVSKDEFKTSWNNEKLDSWKEKRLHGKFVREIPETTHVEESWSWLRKADLKIQTEGLICVGQEQALTTNYVKYHIDKTVESPLCRLCGEKGESVHHIVCECKKLAQREYKQRHDVAKVVHWKLCEKYHLEKKDKWYEHAPDSVSENDEVKLLWDVNSQCDHVNEARRPDIVVVNKQERKCTIIDIAVPADKRIGEKENEKVEKYQDLKREIARMWNMRTLQVVPIVVGSLRSVT